jgi:uncharacterized protein (TIGR02996 family)
MKRPSTRDGFLQALRAAPRDAGLRLIFADWLTEQGQEDAAREQLLRAFDSAAAGRDYYIVRDGRARWGGWTGGLVRAVAEGFHVLRDGDRVELLTEGAFQRLRRAGLLRPEADYDADEEAAAQRCPWCRARSSEGGCEHLLAALCHNDSLGPLAVDGGELARLPARTADAFERRLAVLIQARRPAAAGLLTRPAARLRDLVEGLERDYRRYGADPEDDGRLLDRGTSAFHLRDYLRAACAGAGAKIRRWDYEVGGGPGHGESIELWWARDAVKIARQVARLVEHDAQVLQQAAGRARQLLRAARTSTRASASRPTQPRRKGA